MTALAHNLAFTIADMAKKRAAVESAKKVAAGTRVDPDLFEQFKALADADQRTVSFLIEKAIREYVANHQADADRKRR